MLRRLVLAALALIAPLLLAAAPAQAGCGGPKHAAARFQPDRHGRAPLVIGDSTMLISAPVLGRLGLETNAQGCRPMSAGLEILRARRTNGTLPAVVVLALGANGAATAGQISSALSILGPRRLLILVTPRNSEPTRQRMRAAARRAPDRVRALDWTSYSAGKDWFSGDGLHVSFRGADAYANYIARAVRPLAYPPVSKLRIPHALAGAPRDCGAFTHRGRQAHAYVLRGRSRIACDRVLQLARRPFLQPTPNWTAYDWRRTSAGPWSWVLARADRTVLVGITLS